jgi:glutaredoxin
MAVLTLYQFPDCPYCAKVRAHLDEKRMEYKRVNVARAREDPQRKEIAEKSGVLTVPVLHVKERDRWIGESDRIIEFVDENL